MAKITAPVKDFNGDIAGVQFSNGSAETDNEAVISYCAGAGYTVEGETAPPADEAPEPAPAEGESPAGNASKAEWHAYALTQGYTEEGLEGRTRDEIRALINEE